MKLSDKLYNESIRSQKEVENIFNSDSPNKDDELYNNMLYNSFAIDDIIKQSVVKNES